MALYSSIRRAFKSTIPLALRSVATATAPAVGNGDCGGASRSFSIPVLHYSTSAVKKKGKHRSLDHILLQIVDSEIKYAIDSEFHECVSSCNLNPDMKCQMSFRLKLCIMFGLDLIT